MDYFLNIIITLILLGFTLSAEGQENPVYNHYYNNPYLFNPAETASDAYMSVKMNHRQQWRGVEGAPVVSTFSFQTPFDYKKWAIGVNIRNFERGIITTTDALATYAYTVYLTKTSTLHFGLSAGLTSNNIDLREIGDVSDPVLIDFLNNNMQAIANFGFKLQTPTGLNFGVSLPRLFRPNFLNEQDFSNYDFSPFDEIVVMTYFKRKLEKKIVTKKRGGIKRRVAVEDAYAPLQFYIFYKHSKITDKRLEVLATLNLGDNVWVGGAYRLNYGMVGLMGFNIKSFNFSYAYEPSGNIVEGFMQGTHEIQLGLNIGEKKKLMRSKPILKTLQKTETHQARFSHEEIQAGGSGEESTGGKKYYVVIKTFGDFNSADDFVRKLKEEDLITNIFYNKKDRKFYVYIYETTSSKEANKEKKAVEDLTKYKNIQIIVIDQ